MTAESKIYHKADRKLQQQILQQTANTALTGLAQAAKSECSRYCNTPCSKTCARLVTAKCSTDCRAYILVRTSAHTATANTICLMSAIAINGASLDWQAGTPMLYMSQAGRNAVGIHVGGSLQAQCTFLGWRKLRSKPQNALKSCVVLSQLLHLQQHQQSHACTL